MGTRRIRTMRLAGAAAVSSILWMTLTGISAADTGLLGSADSDLVAGATQPQAGAPAQGAAPPSNPVATILNSPGTSAPVAEAQALPGSGSPLPAQAPAAPTPASPSTASPAAPPSALAPVQAVAQAVPLVTQALGAPPPAAGAVAQTQQKATEVVSTTTAQVSETLTQVTEQVSDSVAQVNEAAETAASASTPSAPTGATSALETLPETLAEVEEVVDEVLTEATTVAPNQKPTSPLAETLETVVEAPLTGLPDLGVAPSQQGSATLVEVNTPVLDLSLQTAAVSDILSVPASSVPAAPAGAAASTPANPSTSSALSTGTVATTQTDASAGSGSIASAPRDASPPASQPFADPSINGPASPNATPPTLEQVEGLEPWVSNFGASNQIGAATEGDTGSLTPGREGQQSSSPDASTSDRPSLSPPRLLPEIARTIGADGWMVPWMAAAFVLATCFASFYIFAVRRS